MNSNENLATLTFFTNSKYQGFVANRTGNQKEKHLAELRFYRKRILGLTKDLAKVAATNTKGVLDNTKGVLDNTNLSFEEGDDGDDDGLEDGDDLAKPLLVAYENYALQLIRYFKMLDTKDILQEKYEQMDIATRNNNNVNGEDDDEFKNNNYNDPLLNKRLHVANLDNYVQVKQTTVVKSPMVIPTIVSIDLQTPELKTKGVKKKEKKVLDAPSPSIVVEDEPSFIEQLLSPPKVVVVQDEIAPKKKQYKGKKKTGKPALPTVKEDEEF